MQQLKRILNQAAKNLETFSHPRVSMALQGSDLIYTRVYNPSSDLADKNIVGKRLEDVIGNRTEAKRLESIKREVLRTGQLHHEVLALVLGNQKHVIDVSIEPTYDDAGKIDGLMSINIDITDLVQAREQLATANARLVKLLDSALDETPKRAKR